MLTSIDVPLEKLRFVRGTEFQLSKVKQNILKIKNMIFCFIKYYKAK